MPREDATFDWRDGYPYPRALAPYTGEGYRSEFPAAAAQIYRPKKWRDWDDKAQCGKEGCTGCYLEAGGMMPGEDEFEGMTVTRVAAIRNARSASYGDFDAFDRQSDRVIGKPKQEVSTLNITMDVASVLDRIMIADQEKLKIEDVTNKVDKYLEGL